MVNNKEYPVVFESIFDVMIRKARVVKVPSSQVYRMYQRELLQQRINFRTVGIPEHWGAVPEAVMEAKAEQATWKHFFPKEKYPGSKGDILFQQWFRQHIQMDLSNTASGVGYNVPQHWQPMPMYNSYHSWPTATQNNMTFTSYQPACAFQPATGPYFNIQPGALHMTFAGHIPPTPDPQPSQLPPSRPLAPPRVSPPAFPAPSISGPSAPPAHEPLFSFSSVPVHKDRAAILALSGFHPDPIISQPHALSNISNISRSQLMSSTQSPPVIPAQTELGKRHSDPLQVRISSATPEEAKRILGEVLFPKIQLIRPELAREITRIILEMDNEELMNLYKDHYGLREKVLEAVIVYDAYIKNKGGEESGEASIDGMTRAPEARVPGLFYQQVTSRGQMQSTGTVQEPPQRSEYTHTGRSDTRIYRTREPNEAVGNRRRSRSPDTSSPYPIADGRVAQTSTVKSEQRLHQTYALSPTSSQDTKPQNDQCTPQQHTHQLPPKSVPVAGAEDNIVMVERASVSYEQTRDEEVTHVAVQHFSPSLQPLHQTKQ